MSSPSADTIKVVGGYAMSTIIVVTMLICDGETAAAIGAAAALAGAGLGSYIGKRKSAA